MIKRATVLSSLIPGSVCRCSGALLFNVSGPGSLLAFWRRSHAGNVLIKCVIGSRGWSCDLRFAGPIASRSARRHGRMRMDHLPDHAATILLGRTIDPDFFAGVGGIILQRR